MHEDPITKARKLTNTSGAVTSSALADPFGGEIASGPWVLNGAQQPRKFTTYARDADGADEAGHRRYRPSWGRFDQPDPADFSYDLSDPQSLNRYAYTQNDPVNFTDPSGLSPNICWVEHGEIRCAGNRLPPLELPGADQGYGAFGGFGGGFDLNDRPRAGFGTISLRENAADPRFHAWSDPWERLVEVRFPSMFGAHGWGGFFGAARGQQGPLDPREQRALDYKKCWEDEVAKLVEQFRPELERIMNRNLRNTTVGGLGTGSIVSTVSFIKGGIGMAGGVLLSLFNWYDQVIDFEREKLGPARAAAKKRCRDKFGNLGNLGEIK